MLVIFAFICLVSSVTQDEKDAMCALTNSISFRTDDYSTIYRQGMGLGWNCSLVDLLCVSPSINWNGVRCLDDHIVSIGIMKKKIYYWNGSLPEELGKLTYLNEFLLDAGDSFEYGLTGTIPDVFQNLQALSLRGNLLSGTIPSEIFQFPNLTLLDLSYNQLNGTVSDSTFTKLLYLNLQGNYLSGTIPSMLLFGNASKRPTYSDSIYDAYINYGPKRTSTEIHLDGNSFVGTVPSISENIYLLNLQDNGLSGTIPWKDTKNIIHLSLANNLLTGTVPNPIQVMTLDLHGNQFEGCFPHLKSSGAYCDVQGSSFNCECSAPKNCEGYWYCTNQPVPEDNTALVVGLSVGLSVFVVLVIVIVVVVWFKTRTVDDNHYQNMEGK